ncbi:MAG: radical SAM family heme chaperone HemW [Pseudomonadota bacterium]
MNPADIPLSVYIHWPWCLAKCPYCDFNSHRAPSPSTRDNSRETYVQALLRDLESQQALVQGRSAHTVFLGGGTPSLFTPDEVGRVLESLSAAVTFEPDTEVTMEVNPGALEHGSLAGYRAAGVNRASIGAQSFDTAALQRLGRLHSPDETRSAVDQARAAGFERINIDLMHGLPGQNLEAGQSDVRSAIALDVDHISYYQLTLEPNTRFHAFPPQLPDESVLEDIAASGATALTGAGFEQYEVSAWSKPGQACRHNLNYWLFGDYLAIGAGAHGKLSFSDGVYRYARAAHPRSYMEVAVQPPEITVLDNAAVVFEFMLNALRLADGFSSAVFEQRTGRSFELIRRRIETAVERGLMVSDETDRWTTTDLGKRFLNDLQAHFLS